MYLYLGQNVVIRDEEILGIFDLENTTISKHTRKFLNEAQKENVVEAVTLDIPKAFVVTASPRTKKEKRRVYLTQMSPATLRKRVQEYTHPKKK